MRGDLYGALRAACPDPARPLFSLPGGATVSYGETFALAGRFANLLTGFGVRPGDRVAMQVDKSWQAIALYLGTLRAGAVHLPLNMAYTPGEIGYFLRDAEPRLFVCAPGTPVPEDAATHIETLGADGEGSLMAAAAEAEEAFTDMPRAPDDLAAILYTSGTTGRAKGAMLTQGNLLSNAATLAGIWRFTADDVLLHALPIFHTHGLFVAVNTVMLTGARMIWFAKFDAGRVLAAMPGATAMMGVPTFYTRLLAHPGLTPEATAHMRLFISGSAPLLAETHHAFEARTGQRILERYGMTETGMSASNPYDGERRAGTVGFPLPGVEARIADPDTGRCLPAGEVGILEVKGPNVFPGYWRMPEKTAEDFRPDGFFITGDMAKIDADGYIHIVGRAKDLVISGGFNVYPKEVESEIDALPGVVESAVIGVKHPDFGEGVTAVVVPEPDTAHDEDAIMKALDGRLARFKQPKRVLFVDALPRNAMGKVQKSELRSRYADLYTGAAAAE